MAVVEQLPPSKFLLERYTNGPDFTLTSQYSSFKSDLKPSKLVLGSFELLFCSLPPIFLLITEFLESFITINIAVSSTDQITIKAYSTGVTFLWLFGYSVMSSFNSNLIKLIAQAYGARDPFAVGMHFQSALYFQLPLLACYLASIFWTKELLHILAFRLEESPDIVDATKTFLWWSVPGVLYSGIFDVMRIYLNGQDQFILPLYARVSATIINSLLALTLVNKYQIVGLAIAKNIGELSGIIILVILTRRLQLTSWIRPQIGAIANILDYAKQVIPGGFAVYLHSFYMEILTIFVTKLNHRATMKAHVSFVNLRPLFFAIPLGTSVTVTSFVGQAVGEQALKKAQTASLMGVIVCNLYFVLQICVGYFLLSPLKRLLSISDEHEALQFEIIFNLYIFFIIYLESHQFMFCGIMKGVGMLSYNLKYYTLGFYFVGISFASTFIYLNKLSLSVIWISYLLSNLVVVLFQISFLYKADWRSLIKTKDFEMDNSMEIPLLDIHNQHAFPKPASTAAETSEGHQ